ncbi:hypothetical protein RHMOL_Rhmol05G0290500 [Rhododendron molle]|uniref:Uncharacterized protein n=1 Tax=Rhododendron molle TaxID=49168 RepID=A0ACC0NU50_RHOML|nr:hypothetical protein RHMOL_Rhmol05G0290500 [Rhododendron molle]
MGGSQSTEARVTFHLPIEITIEILSRLPVKSLLRFKSVCKTWYVLIKSDDFVAKHLQTHSALNSASLLVTTFNRKTKNCVMSLVVNDGFNNGPINLYFPSFKMRSYLSVGGICNGLVCVSVSRYGFPLILCNPATRQFREIPGAEWQLAHIPDYNVLKVKWISYGFGFHPSTNDYKLIRIVYYASPIRKHNIRADLYVTSTDTWTKIDPKKLSLFVGEEDEFGEDNNFMFMEIFGSPASAVLSGVFYWPAHVASTNELIVVSFDMGDEVFREIRTPSCLNETWDAMNWRLTELNDKLALFILPCDRYYDVLDLWVLNESESSWTNQFKVRSSPRIASTVGNGELGELTVLGCAKNGQLLVTYHTISGDIPYDVFLYDPKTWKTVDLYIAQVEYAPPVYLYEGTLVLLKQPNEVMEVEEEALNSWKWLKSYVQLSSDVSSFEFLVSSAE